MTILGSYPSHRYSKSWVTQRLMNRAPQWALVRSNPNSIGQQLVNPLAKDIEDTYQQLSRERFNQFVTTSDMYQLSSLYYLDIPTEINLTQEDTVNGTIIYTPPSVYAEINNIEYQLTQAEKNNIQTLGYDCLPSRIEDADLSYPYETILPTSLVSSLSSITIGDVSIPGYLYITIQNNDVWEITNVDTTYYNKVYITGKTRKGTILTESIPIRYNGTFKTVNEWQEITEVFVSYMGDSATICLEIFPFNRVSYLDTFNVLTESDGERLGFLRLEERTYGSSLVEEGYITPDLEIVRRGLEEKEVYQEIELLNSAGSNITAIDFVVKPNSRFLYAIDATKFYVYDYSLPAPSIANLIDESPEVKMDLYPNRWICNKDDLVSVSTRTLSFSDPPYKVRWHLLSPSGSEYYVLSDGTLVATTEDAWIENELWGNTNWREQSIDFLLNERGEWIVSLTCMYMNEKTNETKSLTTKLLLFVPSITPEVEFNLPTGFENSEKISIDSDGNVWVLKNDEIKKLDLFYDYFLVDYTGRRIWFREDYSNVRVTL